MLAIPGVAQLSLKVLVVKVKAKSGRSPSFIKVDSFNMSFLVLGLKMIFLDRLNHPCAPNPLTHLKERCLLIQLAFAKAFRLRGDNARLKSSVASKFDSAMVSAALKVLWDFSRDDLTGLGCAYRNQRNPDKQQLLDTVISDLMIAFETLDLDEALPSIYFEAKDLPSLPTFELDPVSKQLEANTKELKSLRTSVKYLPSEMKKPIQDQTLPQLQSLKALVQSVQEMKDQLSESISSSVKLIKDSATQHSNLVSPHSCTKTPPRLDRKSNVIIFGLQEKSLVDTRKDVDTILHFLCGRTVPFNNAFRLGHFNADQITAPPRPLLVKLYSMWDRRVIVANKRILKCLFVKTSLLKNVRKGLNNGRRE